VEKRFGSMKLVELGQPEFRLKKSRSVRAFTATQAYISTPVVQVYNFIFTMRGTTRPRFSHFGDRAYVCSS